MGDFIVNPFWVYLWGISESISTTIDGIGWFLCAIGFMALMVKIIGSLIYNFLISDTDYNESVREGWKVGRDKLAEISGCMVKWFYVGLVLILIAVGIPDKQTILYMAVANTVTKSNVTNTVDLVEDKTKNFIEFIFNELEGNKQVKSLFEDKVSE